MTVRNGRHPYQRSRKQQIPDELKFFDTELVSQAFSTGWLPMNPATVDCLNAVVQGPERNDRIGRIYWIKSVFIKGEVNINASEGTSAPFPDTGFRICLVNDHNTNAIEVVASEVMDTAHTTDIHAFRNLDRSTRFNILWDHYFNFVRFYVAEGTNLFTHGIQRRKFEKFIVFKNPIKIECTGTGGTIATLTGNSLQLIGIAQDASLLLSYQCRIRFYG